MLTSYRQHLQSKIHGYEISAVEPNLNELNLIIIGFLEQGLGVLVSDSKSLKPKEKSVRCGLVL